MKKYKLINNINLFSKYELSKEDIDSINKTIDQRKNYYTYAKKIYVDVIIPCNTGKMVIVKSDGFETTFPIYY